MSLNFDVTRIPNFEEFCYTTGEKGDLRLQPKTDAIAIGLLATGVPAIKDIDTAKLFYHRYTSLVMALGTLDYINITEKDVINHIGITSNASTITPHKFKLKLADALSDRAETRIRIERNKLLDELTADN